MSLIVSWEVGLSTTFRSPDRSREDFSRSSPSVRPTVGLLAEEDEGQVSTFILYSRIVMGGYSSRSSKRCEEREIEAKYTRKGPTSITALTFEGALSGVGRHELSRTISQGIPNFPCLRSQVRTRSKKRGAKRKSFPRQKHISYTAFEQRTTLLCLMVEVEKFRKLARG